MKFINEKRYHRMLYAFVVLACLLFANMSVYAQGFQVTGVVSDESGETLPGVNVMVKGTTVGAVTDVNGNYSITVPDGDAVLQFSFVGYHPQDIVVGNQRQIMVTMAESSTVLSEVVVIGYGTARRSDITGSIVSIKADAIREMPSTNVMQALQGRLPGVDMINTGNDNPQVDFANVSTKTRANLVNIQDNNKYYLRPIPTSFLNALDMTEAEKAAFQNPGY